MLCNAKHEQNCSRGRLRVPFRCLIIAAFLCLPASDVNPDSLLNMHIALGE
jgi:hypothetical protein